jgi:RNA polymerase sigma factor (sigma-70 family)
MGSWNVMEERLRAVSGSDRSEAAPRKGAVDVSALSTFEGFFASESESLYRRMCFVTGNAHEAEEIMQDAFLSMWERWARVSTLEDPTGYLYRTAMNVFRKRYRRAKLAIRHVVAATPAPDPFEGIDDQQDLLTAVAALTARQRAALVLLDVVDMTSEEAGRALGVTPGTARGLATRARAAIRDTMGGGR